MSPGDDDVPHIGPESDPKPWTSWTDLRAGLEVDEDHVAALGRLTEVAQVLYDTYHRRVRTDPRVRERPWLTDSDFVMLDEGGDGALLVNLERIAAAMGGRLELRLVLEDEVVDLLSEDRLADPPPDM